MGKPELAWLTGLLGLSPEELEKPIAFEKRLKAQKAVFLLRHLGVKPFKSYPFNLYLRGPYSPVLAADYYRLSEVEPSPVKLGGKGTVLKWFVSHDSEWLEVASSILWVKERYPNMADEKELHRLLLLSKPWVGEELFGSILAELREKGLLR